MPLRSPKMYFFIFGFQRLVWCPKCTPASSNSFIAIGVKRPPYLRYLLVERNDSAPDSVLAFAELESLARAGHAVLLAFLRACVSGEQSTLFELLPQLGVVTHERARNPKAHSAGLAVDAAAGHSGHDVKLLNGFGQQQRLLDLGSQGFGGEERFELAVIDGNGAFAGPRKTRAEDVFRRPVA